jgi:adenylate cyclase
MRAGTGCVGSALFTDLVGFTEYTDLLGDAAAVEVLDEQRRMADDAVAARPSGRIVKELGDGLMLWFTSPLDALTCAIAFLAAIAASRDTGSFPLAVRLGLHHGEARARGDDVVGQTVNIASRVSDLAGPNELLVTEQVVTECAAKMPDLTFRPIGPTSVKGVADPVWLHRVDIAPTG